MPITLTLQLSSIVILQKLILKQKYIWKLLNNLCYHCYFSKINVLQKKHIVSQYIRTVSEYINLVLFVKTSITQLVFLLQTNCPTKKENIGY